MARVLVLILMLTACAQRVLQPNRPVLDVSPVGCGYKWFQTGYSRDVSMACAADRAFMKGEQLGQAAVQAWEIARLRCPAECPPVELKDSAPWRNPSPNGVCRNDSVYFHTRVFFKCAPLR